MTLKISVNVIPTEQGDEGSLFRNNEISHTKFEMTNYIWVNIYIITGYNVGVEAECSLYKYSIHILRRGCCVYTKPVVLNLLVCAY